MDRSIALQCNTASPNPSKGGGFGSALIELLSKKRGCKFCDSIIGDKVFENIFLNSVKEYCYTKLTIKN